MYPDPDSPLAASRPTPVLVVGAGALGCAAARTLAQDRRVEVTLVDDDVVEPSNLQRQVLYDGTDLGTPKVEAAARRLADDFGAAVRPVVGRFDPERGPALVREAAIVVDATDDPPTKFLIGRLCDEAGRPWVYGGVARTGGQWMLVEPGVSACLECVFPAPAPMGAPASDEPLAAPETAEGCAALGILAPVAGLVGAMQALAVLRRLHRPSTAVAGRLHVYELRGARSRHVDFPPNASCTCAATRRRHAS